MENLWQSLYSTLADMNRIPVLGGEKFISALSVFLFPLLLLCITLSFLNYPIVIEYAVSCFHSIFSLHLNLENYYCQIFKLSSSSHAHLHET